MIVPPILPFTSKKKILRQQAEAERNAAAQARPDAGEHAARNFLASVPLRDGATISLFASFRDEIDTWPLVGALIERGHRLALPVTGKKGEPLTFREFKIGDELIPDSFGVPTPAPAAPELTPEIVVTPLLAFTRRGDRLGYGAGFYDRTLARLRREGEVLAVGFAFGAQEVDHLPTEDHDQPLDWIVTEREAFAV
ncbi:MAG: 5-formyltetrahydrofolate cyclo-ligase [Parvularculaceae bacterium]|nr:5-formyltetrahydrofolate cyclo-ligase [Parvularculaceae bacterium]